MAGRDQRLPVLYLAPWVDIGGSDKGTIDWFRFLDRDRFRPSLITTQPSANRRLGEVAPYADEVWDLPQLMLGHEAARFIIGFVRTRGVKVVHIMNSRLGFELLPEIASLPGERPLHSTRRAFSCAPASMTLPVIAPVNASAQG